MNVRGTEFIGGKFFRYISIIALLLAIGGIPALSQAERPDFDFLKKNSEESGVKFEGNVTALKKDSISVNGVHFRITDDTEIRDQGGNLLPRKALSNAISVKLEVEDGTAKTIYVHIQTQ